jgi:hypothetical protein
VKSSGLDPASEPDWAAGLSSADADRRHVIDVRRHNSTATRLAVEQREIAGCGLKPRFVRIERA